MDHFIAEALKGLDVQTEPYQDGVKLKFLNSSDYDTFKNAMNASGNGNRIMHISMDKLEVFVGPIKNGTSF